MPFDSAAFDGLVCFQVLSVINKPRMFFRELARLVKPGGYLLLSTDFLYPKWAQNDWCRYTDVALRSLAVDSGFEVIAIEGFGGWTTTVHCLIMGWLRDYPWRIQQTPNILLRVCAWSSILAGWPPYQGGPLPGGWCSC